MKNKGQKIVSRWFSGFFGALALLHLVKALVGFDLVIPQFGLTIGTFISVTVFVVAAALSVFFWMYAAYEAPKKKKRKRKRKK